MMVITDADVLKAVEQYVCDRHAHLSPSTIIGWDDEEMARAKVDERGYLLFDVVVNIEETEEDKDVGKVWYVASTMFFQVTEGEPIDTDEEVYEAYMGSDGEWCIQWDHS